MPSKDAPAPPGPDLSDLPGTAFPGGTYTVGRWENVVLHAASVADRPVGEIVHPMALFHAPITGSGWSIADIFERCHAESDEAVRAGEYLWELHRPLREGVPYRVDGRFESVERKSGRRIGAFDKVTFRLDLYEPEADEPAATVTQAWLFLRSGA